MEKIYENCPECIECGGLCCEQLNAFIKHDKKPWARKRFLQRLSEQEESVEILDIWELKGAIWIKNGYIGASFVCKNYKNGRCIDYENRPLICKRYPSEDALKRDSGETACALVNRLRRDK